MYWFCLQRKVRCFHGRIYCIGVLVNVNFMVKFSNFKIKSQKVAVKFVSLHKFNLGLCYFQAPKAI